MLIKNTKKIKINHKKIFFIIIKLVVIILLINQIELLTYNSNLRVYSDFLKNGIGSMYIISETGERIIDVKKILTLFSLYIVIELEMLEYTLYMASDFKKIIKYYSKNIKFYFYNIIRVGVKYIIKSNFYWFIAMLIPIITLFLTGNNININIFDIINIIIFLIINTIIMLTINIYSSKISEVYILYFLKIIILTSFVVNKYIGVAVFGILIITKLVLDIIYGEKYENSIEKCKKNI